MTWSLLAVVGLIAWSLYGHRFLRAFHHRHRASPRVMLGLWCLGIASWASTCVVLAGALASQVMGPGVKALIAACLNLVQAIDANDAGAGLIVIAGASTLALTRLGWVAVRRRRKRNHWLIRHRRWLLSQASRRTIDREDFWLVHDPLPRAYCLPGRGEDIVVSVGGLERLTRRELQAVLAHERAHLRGRHHLLTTWARLLDRAFPGVPLLAAASVEISELVEWVADDHAAREVSPNALAHALGRMAVPEGAPDPTLSIGGACPVRRVRRQIAPHEPSAGAALTLLAVASTAAPLVLAVAAVVLNVALPHCECVG